MTIHIEIAKSYRAGKYRIRIGDVEGSIGLSCISKADVLEEVSDACDELMGNSSQDKEKNTEIDWKDSSGQMFLEIEDILTESARNFRKGLCKILNEYNVSRGGAKRSAKSHQWEIELCNTCRCLTHTMDDGTCGKCGAVKQPNMNQKGKE